MAVLSGRDRAQLLLLGAIVIGFVIVTLSLTLNGGLYAETIANEAVDDVSNEETRYLLSDIRGDGAYLLARAIATHPSDVGQQETYVRENVQRLDTQYSQYYAHSDAAVGVGVASTAPGSRYSQSSPGSLALPTAITGGRVRNVSVTITGDGPSTGTADLVFDDGGGEIYRVEMESNGRVAVDRDGTTVECTASGSISTPYTVNVSTATVNGQPCPALEFGSELDSAYNVEFVNGDAVEGTYYMIASTDTGPDPVLYSIDLTVTHRTTTADYEGTIRVAPGEI